MVVCGEKVHTIITSYKKKKGARIGKGQEFGRLTTKSLTGPSWMYIRGFLRAPSVESMGKQCTLLTRERKRERETQRERERKREREREREREKNGVGERQGGRVRDT